MTTLPIRQAYQGDTLNMDFRLQEPDGSYLDLDTASQITWSMSDPEELDTPVLEKTVGSGITVISATDGALRVTVTAGQLDTPGTYVHEIEATISGATYTYGQGQLIVKPTVMPS